VNSASVLLTDHPAPTSEFSAEEEEEEEVNNISTSKGDLDSDPATGLLFPVLIRQQTTVKKKKKKSTVKSPSIQEATAAVGKGQSLLPQVLPQKKAVTTGERRRPNNNKVFRSILDRLSSEKHKHQRGVERQ
jgi:hypothetical protein